MLPEGLRYGHLFPCRLLPVPFVGPMDAEPLGGARQRVDAQHAERPARDRVAERGRAVRRAGGLGAFGAMICAFVRRRLTWPAVYEACKITLRLSCMVMWIVFAAAIFTSLYAAVGADQLVRDSLSLLPGGRWGVLIGMQVIWIIMGCFLDPIGIMILTAPLFFPIATQLGFDPVWLGVLFVVNMEMAFLTPPFGFNLFYLRSVAPPNVTMADIYRSVGPFVALQALALGLMMIFPGLITWLPYTLMR